MSKIIIAHYFLANAQAPANASLPEAVSLKINNGEVKFFQSPLIEEDAFLMFSEHLWRLDFFQQSDFNQTIWVKLVDADTSLSIDEIKDSLKPRVKTERIKFSDNKTLGYALFMVGDIERMDDEQISVISQVLRGSNTLTAEAFTPLGVDSQLFMDGRGFALITTNPLKLTNFKRQVLLACLGKAYLLSLEQAVCELAEHCENYEYLAWLYRASAMFNAKYYFNQPVHSDRIELFPFWKAVRETLPIEEMSQELRDQLSSTHRLLEQDQAALAAVQEKKMSKRVTYFGLVIGLLSLFALVEITPSKVMAFLGGWWGLFS